MNHPLDEERMWKMAERRVAFKRHLFVYIVINLMLIALWYFTSYKDGDTAGYWFIWPLMGWGIGVMFNYWGAYHDDQGSVDREYQKIKSRYGNPNDTGKA